MFSAAIVAAFRLEDNHLEGVRIQGPEVQVGASSAVESAGHHSAANPKSWTGSCTPRRRSLGRLGSRGCSCLHHYIRHRSHLANILPATLRKAKEHYCIVAEAVSAPEAEGMT